MANGLLGDFAHHNGSLLLVGSLGMELEDHQAKNDQLDVTRLIPLSLGCGANVPCSLGWLAALHRLRCWIRPNTAGGRSGL